MTRRSTRTALVTAAVAAGGATVLLLATPGLAANGPTGPSGRDRPSGTRVAATSTCPMGDAADGLGNGWRSGPGAATAYGMRGRGPTDGVARRGMQGDPAADLPASGTLTSAQRTTLAAMAEEEKLSHDVYVALAAATGDARFSRVAAAESRHLDAVRVLMTRYGVDDPTAGKAAGEFATASVQGSHDRLVERGSVSLDAALAVGRTIETTDIADLATAMTGLDAPDVRTVYGRLSTASQHHLAAFGG